MMKGTALNVLDPQGNIYQMSFDEVENLPKHGARHKAEP